MFFHLKTQLRRISFLDYFNITKTIYSGFILKNKKKRYEKISRKELCVYKFILFKFLKNIRSYININIIFRQLV